jgi:hypothetical protein
MLNVFLDLRLIASKSSNSYSCLGTESHYDESLKGVGSKYIQELYPRVQKKGSHDVGLDAIDALEVLRCVWCDVI